MRYEIPKETQARIKKAIKHFDMASITFWFNNNHSNEVTAIVRDWQWEGEEKITSHSENNYMGDTCVVVSLYEDDALVDFILKAKYIETYRDNFSYVDSLKITNERGGEYKYQTVIFRDDKGKRLKYSDFIHVDSIDTLGLVRKA